METDSAEGPVSARVDLGDAELISMVDAEGVLGTLEELFPRVEARGWEPYRRLYPELFSDDSWRFPFGCFVVRNQSACVLIDTGVGPPGGGQFLTERQGWLLENLEGSGVARSDVTHVVLTHLHIDHIGWATSDAAPTFPNARYVAPLADQHWAWKREPVERTPVVKVIQPLLDAGVLELVDGITGVAEGVELLPTPGHTPGHMSLRIKGDRQEAVVLADVAVHPVQLDQPSWSYVFDVDPELAIRTRSALVDEIVTRGIVAACGHYPRGGIGTLRVEDGHRVWRAFGEFS
jgi:glyoxylase-like metal-dependent hydrolase (beta-lactamase superfamily II)